jgi:hypothetical protein
MEIKYRKDLHLLLPKNPVVAEIGCAEGLFSHDILQWGTSLLYMVDMWESHPEFPGDAGFEQEWHTKNYKDAMNRIEEYNSKVKVLRGSSVSMAQNVPNGSLDLVYIDACHSYECVMNDLKAWLPKVKKGGIVAGHDYLNPDYGVYQAVNEFASKYTVKTILENKMVDAGFWFRV